MSTVNVRYMVDDVDAAVAFYTTHFGFTLLSNASPAFADVTLGDLRLLLSGPTSSAGRPMVDGRRPMPGGWNRIHFVVDDLTTRSSDCAWPAYSSAMRSSLGPADHRSCWTIRRATPSNCSNPRGVEPNTEVGNTTRTRPQDQFLDLIFRDRQLSVSRNELKVRPPGAPPIELIGRLARVQIGGRNVGQRYFTSVLRLRYRHEMRAYVTVPAREDLTLDLWIDIIDERRRTHG